MPNPRLLLANEDEALNLEATEILRARNYHVECAIDFVEPQKKLFAAWKAGPPYDLLICRNFLEMGYGAHLIRIAWEHYQVPSLALVEPPPEAMIPRAYEFLEVPEGSLRGRLDVPCSVDEFLVALDKALRGDVKGSFDPLLY